MASRYVEASEADLAGQAMPVDDAEDPDAFAGEISATTEANPSDVLEQHRTVPTDEDDYDR